MLGKRSVQKELFLKFPFKTTPPPKIFLPTPLESYVSSFRGISADIIYSMHVEEHDIYEGHMAFYIVFPGEPASINNTGNRKMYDSVRDIFVDFPCSQDYLTCGPHSGSAVLVR